MTNLSSNLEGRDHYSGPIKAVILDWAGTVVDFGSCAPVEAVIEAFRSFGVLLTNEQARAPMGKAKREHILAILEMPEIGAKWQAANDGNLKQAVDRIYGRFLPIQESVLPGHAKLIPGCLESIEFCRRRGIKIGSSTGYTRELMEILEPIAAEQGYQPDVMLCASDIDPGRPAPWMCLENARQLSVYPLQAIVKVDDTTVGIEAGLNAGMWTVGVAASGNLVGLGHEEFSSLPEDDRQQRVAAARNQLLAAGAHVVVDTIAGLPDALDAIEDSLATEVAAI